MCGDHEDCCTCMYRELSEDVSPCKECVEVIDGNWPNYDSGQTDKGEGDDN